MLNQVCVKHHCTWRLDPSSSNILHKVSQLTLIDEKRLVSFSPLQLIFLQSEEIQHFEQMVFPQKPKKERKNVGAPRCAQAALCLGEGISALDLLPFGLHKPGEMLLENIRRGKGHAFSGTLGSESQVLTCCRVLV